MKPRFVFLSLWFLTAAKMFAADPTLSLEEATKIAKERIAKDGLPTDHLIIHFVDQPPFKDKFYVAWFDPQVPDPQKAGAFVGYNIKMNGEIERAVITETRSRVQAPTKVAGYSEASFDAKKAAASGLLNTPFALRLDTRSTNGGAKP